MNITTSNDKRVGVNFAILKCVEGEWRIALQLRDQNSRDYKHHWCVPGGGLKLHEGTDFVAAATREAADETGLKIATADWQEICNRPEDNPGKVMLAVVPEHSDITECEGAAMEWKSFVEIQEIIDDGKMGFGHQEWIFPVLRNYIQDNLSEHTREYRAEKNQPPPFKIS